MTIKDCIGFVLAAYLASAVAFGVWQITFNILSYLG